MAGTETDAHKHLGNEIWSVSVMELDNFVAVLYDHGIYAASEFDLKGLLSKTWVCCSSAKQCLKTDSEFIVISIS